MINGQTNVAEHHHKSRIETGWQHTWSRPTGPRNQSLTIIYSRLNAELIQPQSARKHGTQL